MDIRFHEMIPLLKFKHFEDNILGYTYCTIHELLSPVGPLAADSSQSLQPNDVIQTVEVMRLIHEAKFSFYNIKYFRKCI